MDKKKIQVIFETGNILMVSNYQEGVSIYMPEGKGVLVHDDITVIQNMLFMAGITNFDLLKQFNQ